MTQFNIYHVLLFLPHFKTLYEPDVLIRNTYVELKKDLLSLIRWLNTCSFLFAFWQIAISFLPELIMSCNTTLSFPSLLQWLFKLLFVVSSSTLHCLVAFRMQPTTGTRRGWTPTKTSETFLPSSTMQTVKWRSLLSSCWQHIVSWPQVSSEATLGDLTYLFLCSADILFHVIHPSIFYTRSILVRVGGDGVYPNCQRVSVQSLISAPEYCC